MTDIEKTVFSRDTKKQVGDTFPVETPQGKQKATVIQRLEENPTYNNTAHGSKKPIARGYYIVVISED